MSTGTARTGTVKSICVSITILVMIVIGSASAATRAIGAGAMAPAAMDVAVQDCDAGPTGGGAGAPCDSDALLASMAYCPMRGLCVNMGSGAGHCASNALPEFAELHPTTFKVMTIRYVQTRVQATGLPAEPMFQPPIV